MLTEDTRYKENITLIVNSKDRLSESNSSTDFKILLQEPINNVKKICLLGVYIPNMCYNIRSNVNDKLTFFENGSVNNISAVLNPGIYSIDDLATHIETQMTAISLSSGQHWNYTCVYSDITLKITISAGGVNTFALKFGSSYSRQCWKILGYNQEDYAAATSQISTNVIAANYPSIINIRINEFLTKIYNTGANQQKYTFSLFCDGLSGYYIQYNNNSNFNLVQFNEPQKNITTLTIQLRDDDDLILNNNNSDWHMILRLE
ncbi:MAG: hypothetical protein WC554_02030 [Clostridia bacterium]